MSSTLGWQYPRKGSYAMTHGWTCEMTLARNQRAAIHVRLQQPLVLRNCDRWTKPTSLSLLLKSDFPERAWSWFAGGHTTDWTLKNVQCFYKNVHFLLSYISTTAKMVFSEGTGGTKVGALDLTLKIIHTNSRPKTVTLHNPIYTNLLL